MRVSTIEEIKEKMMDGEAVGALMDSFTLAHYRKLFPVDEFKVQEVISQEYLEYGARVKNSSLASCLKNLRFSEESELYEYAELYMGNSIKSGMGESMEKHDGSFQIDPEGLLFYPALFTCLGILAFFLLSGATWEICRRSQIGQRSDRKRLDLLMSTSDDSSHEHRRTMATKALLKQFEEKVVEDVRQVLQSFEKLNLTNHSVFTNNNYNGVTNEKLTSV
ncbi:hypothetical protein OS493_011226 [Desmophyllum pertusum]|uniref:Uncharacterized protein n=1 Tax=Desmophyllum pertusum TaxID=174260 RepID=A0A9X0CU75_9CNID|nr:hypothetical protein OS493_011226 [Desmophyllum pertusum]